MPERVARRLLPVCPQALISTLAPRSVQLSFRMAALLPFLSYRYTSTACRSNQSVEAPFFPYLLASAAASACRDGPAGPAHVSTTNVSCVRTAGLPTRTISASFPCLTRAHGAESLPQPHRLEAKLCISLLTPRCCSRVPLVNRVCLRTHQSTTQYRDDNTSITTATGASTTAEAFVNNFFGGEYKYSNRW